MAVKGRWVTQITLPAGARSYPVRAPFVPDWWRVSLLDNVNQIVRVYPGSRAMIGSIPLTGTGQWGFPGEGETDDTILLDNLNTIGVTVGLYASSGFPPDSFVPPVSLAKAVSAEIQAQTRYESTTAGLSFSFNHTHPGGQIFLAFGGGQASYDGDDQIATVTIGGVTATVKGQAHIYGGGGPYPLPNRGQNAGWYVRQNVPAGSVQIIVTFTANVYYFTGWAFSYLEGVRTGNVATQQLSNGNPPTFTVTGQADSSRIYCVVLAWPYGGVVTETSGATPFDALHTLGAGYFGIMLREGAGTQSFDFLSSTWIAIAAVAMEVLPQ